ncbi:hypothetical protein B0H17DRAFT_1204224 [Mycena rosella]|uniref:Uncharacterized protein n=1 Tax=Mycena rosella TaxID=1033263 RepID=A0AAD7DD75_MYCRO|nr:hypothetical protein B0H17DRAFT_1204224 [Mycena rosella]
MEPLPPRLEEIVSALVDYARIFNEQTRLVSLDPEALVVAARDESNRCHLPPLPSETTQEQLERLSGFCYHTPPDSVNACVQILNAAAGCMEIVQRDILDTMSDHERTLVLEKYDKITKEAVTLTTHHAMPPQSGILEPYYDRSAKLERGATMDLARKIPSAMVTLPTLTRSITSTEHSLFTANPLILVGRKFANPTTQETIEILDFGIKLRAGQVIDVAISSTHVARWKATLPWKEVKKMLVDCRAVI